MVEHGEVKFKVRRNVLLLRQFTIDQLVRATGLKAESIRTEVQRLKQDDFVISERQPGQREALYRLSDDPEKRLALSRNVEAFYPEPPQPVPPRPTSRLYKTAVRTLDQAEEEKEGKRTELLDKAAHQLEGAWQAEGASRAPDVVQGYILQQRGRLAYLRGKRESARELLTQAREVFAIADQDAQTRIVDNYLLRVEAPYCTEAEQSSGATTKADRIMMTPWPEGSSNMAKIKVVGIGGGGSNAIDRMIQVGLQGVEFVALNSDAQALMKSEAPVRIRIGDKVTRGLGCWGDPTIGEKAAQESAEEIEEILRGSDMVFVTAGMGGGTGTGGAPIVAEKARDLGALTVAVVTKPFSFEGSRRMKLALDGLERLRKHVDTLIVIPNDRLLEVVDPKASVSQAFLEADDLLRQGIQGISDLITGTGLVNVDFNDVRSIMGDGGSALMAIGNGQGENRAKDAMINAVNSPLLDVSIDGAKGVLLNIKGSEDMSLFEVNEAAEIIRQMVDDDANIIFGATVDEALDSGLEITVIATGFEDPKCMKSKPSRDRSTDKNIAFPLEDSDLDWAAYLGKNSS